MLKKLLIVLTILIGSFVFAQIDDAHYIQADDYFVSDGTLEGHTWIGVNVAKMTQKPSAQTKSEAKFLVVKNGKEFWTENYWHTRIANESELKLGTIVIMLDYSTEGIYIPPKERDKARIASWFMAKITDVSTLYKGYIMVSGGYKIRKDNIRLIDSGENKTVEVVEHKPIAPTISTIVQEIVQPEDSYVAPTSKGGLRIVKATYGDFMPENSVDVADYLNTLIRDGKLTVKANDKFLRVIHKTGDEKSLKIQYQTVDGIFETVVIQGMETNIPNASHRKVK
ncbi:MAG: DUF3395 domain-containing protein [Candidatus Delongbacteria bacterium]|nr:DUF3395 domain-containing protein [Candidatus Delongbacteria bacterium]MCG2760941.1 DUF3395 domain-containing protein [Candidatus Delongbacteria bacterium]